ncbi:hypothetical protein EWM64_g4863 [Hericium alpestre]|uniref:methylated diphthine methylhydrolase n=1 Tax=Hericium alpestre TaxID=135208 RepID=A0A4Y9ZY76_9AGAM|nr:hypothetical protein EWM64_g4863 [Hericium alpestre]
MGSLVVSLSNGELALLRPDPAEGLRVVETWHAHDFEPWIAAWDYWDTNTVYSVGSYDSTVRLFDKRKPMTPLTQADVSGGVWRVKWHPKANRPHDLLVACMHDSFKIVKYRDIWDPNDPKTFTGENWEIVRTFDKHESLGYGVDWSYAEGQDAPGQTLIASASFYDHALYVWKG